MTMTMPMLDRLCLLITLMAWIGFGCTVAPEERAPEFITGNIVWSAPSKSPSQRSPAELPTLNFGVGPWLSPDRMLKAYEPLLEHLQDRTGHQFIMNVSPDYGTLLSDLEAGRLDIAILPSSAYADSLESQPTGLHYLVTSTRSTASGASSPFYYGYIVTALDSPLQNLEGLKGKRFGFVDHKSSSGYRFPLATLLNAGVVPRSDFRDTLFLGTHDAVAAALANETIDAGAIWDEAYDQYTVDGQNPMRIIAKTSPIPEEAWVASSVLEANLREKIKKALLEITRDTKSPVGTPIFSGELRKTGHTAHGSGFYQIMSETKRLVRGYEKTGGPK